MRKFFRYVLCGFMAVAFGPASGDGKKADPEVKRPAKKQEAAKEDKAERPAAAGSVRKEDIDDDGKNKKEKD
jgi:hypothetical protein